MNPCRKPQLSMTTFTTGTRQLVVHEAFEMMWCLAGSYFLSFTAANSTAFCFISTAARTTFLPMRPNPLIPTRTAMHRSLSGEVRNDGPAERDGHDGPRAGGFQGPGGGREGRTRREDVVNQYEGGIRNAECGIDRGQFIPHSAFPMPHCKRPR